MLGGPPPSRRNDGIARRCDDDQHVIGEAILHCHRGERDARRPARAHHAGARRKSRADAEVLGGEPRVHETTLSHKTVDIFHAYVGVVYRNAGHVSHQTNH